MGDRILWHFNGRIKWNILNILLVDVFRILSCGLKGAITLFVGCDGFLMQSCTDRGCTHDLPIIGPAFCLGDTLLPILVL